MYCTKVNNKSELDCIYQLLDKINKPYKPVEYPIWLYITKPNHIYHWTISWKSYNKKQELPEYEEVSQVSFVPLVLGEKMTDKWYVEIPCKEVLDAVVTLIKKVNPSLNLGFDSYFTFSSPEYLLWGHCESKFVQTQRPKHHAQNKKTLDELFTFILQSKPELTVEGYKVEFSKEQVKIGCKTITKEQIPLIKERIIRPTIKIGNEILCSDSTNQEFTLGNIKIPFSKAKEIIERFESQS